MAKDRTAHRAKMQRKAERRERWFRDGVGFYAAQAKQGARVRFNYSMHPKGQKRTQAPRLSIWPAGKAAGPAQFGR